MPINMLPQGGALPPMFGTASQGSLSDLINQLTAIRGTGTGTPMPPSNVTPAQGQLGRLGADAMRMQMDKVLAAQGATNRAMTGMRAGAGLTGAGIALGLTQPLWEPYAAKGINAAKDYGSQALSGLRSAMGY